MNPVDAKNVLIRALGYAAVFLIFNLLWFIFADIIGVTYFPGTNADTGFLSLKEWLNVSFTSFMLFLFVYRSIRKDRKKSNILELSLNELRGFLDEKNILLREVHHRVKNNLQIVSSILSLQSDQAKNTEDAELFESTQNRIIAMSIIHDKLYETGNSTAINMHDYIHEFVHSQAIHRLRKRNIHIDNIAEPVILHVDSAIPCGLIINELMNNALHHAYPPGGMGKISINCFQEKDQTVLRIHDNGTCSCNPDANNTDGSLGLQLVSLLVKQLGGLMEVNIESGTAVTVRFPAHEQ